MGDIAINVSYKPIPGVRSFRLWMTEAGPRLGGTVTRHLYDGPVAHQEAAPPAELRAPEGESAWDSPGAYRLWQQPGFFAFPEDAFNPGYAGGYFAVVARVSLFGTVVRHRLGARAQVMRINELWVAPGRWGQSKPHAVYEAPYHDGLGVPREALAVFCEFPSMLRGLIPPEASGGPQGEALSSALGSAYGCDVHLLETPLSHPRTLEGAGFALVAQDEWKRPVHRSVLIDVPS